MGFGCPVVSSKRAALFTTPASLGRLVSRDGMEKQWTGRDAVEVGLAVLILVLWQ